MPNVGPRLIRPLIVALMVAGPAILPALAYASPPDPSWVPGIYDAADFDDVVVLVVSAAGNIGPAILADDRPVPLLLGSLPQTTEGGCLVLRLSQIRPRAPPLPVVARPLSTG